MFYLDTSVLVAAMTNEAASDATRLWLGEQKPGELAISDWSLVEF